MALLKGKIGCVFILTANIICLFIIGFRFVSCGNFLDTNAVVKRHCDDGNNTEAGGPRRADLTSSNNYAMIRQDRSGDLFERTLFNYVKSPNMSMECPFVFFHIPKCGGSTLREELVNAAMSIQKQVFAPCYDSIPCATTEEDIFRGNALIDERATCSDIFAGHFSTGLLSTLAKGWTEDRRQAKCGRNLTYFPDESVKSSMTSKFRCLIAVREPISRFVSHYYYFIEKENAFYRGRQLKDMSLEELTTIIQRWANNTMLEYLSAHLPHVFSERRASSLTAQEKVNEAQKVLEECVIVVTEDWGKSALLVESAVPWLKGHVVGAPALNRNNGPSKLKHESIEDFTPDVAVGLKNMLEGDAAVYDYALKIYHQQLRDYLPKKLY